MSRNIFNMNHLKFGSSVIYRSRNKFRLGITQPFISLTRLSTFSQTWCSQCKPGVLLRKNKEVFSSPCSRSLFQYLSNQSKPVLYPRGIQGGRIIFVRDSSSGTPNSSNKNMTTLIYITAIGIFMVGASYAGVPLYRIFCQATGLGGQAVQGHDSSAVEKMKPVKDRLIRVRFNADVSSSMQWNFKPQQSEVKVIPGETALAFYTAKNPTEKPVIGISTYNVLPYEAGQYFNKIQCFCFEEQILNPHEQVDMPVFFFIDPEYAEDPKLETVNEIMLSYTFFEAKDGMTLPLPGFMQPHQQPQAQTG